MIGRPDLGYFHPFLYIQLYTAHAPVPARESVRAPKAILGRVQTLRCGGGESHLFGADTILARTSYKFTDARAGAC
jgi:alpha-D-ribose 1-methylphosphonate 5-triphosphate synthase subunit PhnG